MTNRPLTAAALCLLVSGQVGSPARAEYHVVAVSSLERVFPTDKVEGQREARIWACRDEYESIQIVVQAGAETLRGMTVSVEPLQQVGGRAVIGPQNMTLYLEGYMDVKKVSWRGEGRTGLWPDPLLEPRPIKVPAGENRCFWLRVHVPPDVPAGDYEGRIVVQTRWPRQAPAQSVPLGLHVWDFSLSEGPHLGSFLFFNVGSIHEAYQLESLSFEQWARCYDMYASHHQHTSLWTPGDGAVTFYRETDGSYSVDASGLLQRMEYVVNKWDPPVINLGTGCWGTSGILDPAVYDRATDQRLTNQERQLTSRQAGQLYFDQVCPWLEERGLLDRAFIQIWDEPDRDAWDWGVREGYQFFGSLVPRVRRLCVVGIHPHLQGYVDILCPHTAFADLKTYEMVGNGVSLYGSKSFPAQVTASSSGGWGSGAFYSYRPEDAYDGCAYTKWTPAEPATADKPQWLRFDFEEPAELDGIRIVPYQSDHYEGKMIGLSVEVSTNGENFAPIELQPRDSDSAYSFVPGQWQAARLVWSKSEQEFVSSDRQPVPPPESCGFGVREIEFLSDQHSPEGDLPRETTRRAEVWEYNVGADYPSFRIDAPHNNEHRIFPWIAWSRGVTGLLYYGGCWWTEEMIESRCAQRQPLVWPSHGDANGDPFQFYPAREVDLLPSLRVERMSDGFEDYDYFHLLRKLIHKANRTSRSVDPALLQQAEETLAQTSHETAVRDANWLLAHRRAVAETIEALQQQLD